MDAMTQTHVDRRDRRRPSSRSWSRARRSAPSSSTCGPRGAARAARSARCSRRSPPSATARSRWRRSTSTRTASGNALLQAVREPEHPDRRRVPRRPAGEHVHRRVPRSRRSTGSSTRSCRPRPRSRPTRPRPPRRRATSTGPRRGSARRSPRTRATARRRSGSRGCSSGGEPTTRRVRSWPGTCPTPRPSGSTRRSRSPDWATSPATGPSPRRSGRRRGRRRREALEAMIGALADDRDDARQAMVTVFAVLGDDDPLVARVPAPARGGPVLMADDALPRRRPRLVGRRRLLVRGLARPRADRSRSRPPRGRRRSSRSCPPPRPRCSTSAPGPGRCRSRRPRSGTA